MDAELDPLAGGGLELGPEPVHGRQQGHGVVEGEGDRARPLHRPGGVAGGELDQPAQRDPGDAAVVDVDGLVDDRVEALGGPGRQHRQDVVAAGQAVAERPALGRPGPEAADVDRAGRGQPEQGVDRLGGAGEAVAGPVAAQAGMPLGQAGSRAEADKLGHVGPRRQTAQHLVLERRHGPSIEARHDSRGGPVELAELQRRIEALYGTRDRARGVDGTFRWWVEEVGEVAKALRGGDPAALEHELGDALAWLASVANLAGVDLAAAVARYAGDCPRCGATPCACPTA
jgi:NTP pyrophosphatase (non-canonical NTP hydrolase)